jgi:hypothetical protein
MTIRSFVLAIATVVAACDDGASQLCRATALEVDYDNSYGGLGAENVQDAIDELAARPLAEEPLERRMYFSRSAGVFGGEPGLYSIVAACDEGDLAISGSCGTNKTGDGQLNPVVQVVSFGHYDKPNEWHCEFLRTAPEPETSSLGANCVCLKVSVDFPPISSL